MHARLLREPDDDGVEKKQRAYLLAHKPGLGAFDLRQYQPQAL
jgi:hypothetical protein